MKWRTKPGSCSLGGLEPKRASPIEIHSPIWHQALGLTGKIPNWSALLRPSAKPSEMRPRNEEGTERRPRQAKSISRFMGPLKSSFPVAVHQLVIRFHACMNRCPGHAINGYDGCWLILILMSAACPQQGRDREESALMASISIDRRVAFSLVNWPCEMQLQVWVQIWSLPVIPAQAASCLPQESSSGSLVNERASAIGHWIAAREHLTFCSAVSSLTNPIDNWLCQSHAFANKPTMATMLVMKCSKGPK